LLTRRARQESARPSTPSKIVLAAPRSPTLLGAVRLSPVIPGADGPQVTHYFDREADAGHASADVDAVPLELSNWAEMKIFKEHPR
jgi:hypothetical protein